MVDITNWGNKFSHESGAKLSIVNSDERSNSIAKSPSGIYFLDRGNQSIYSSRSVITLTNVQILEEIYYILATIM